MSTTKSKKVDLDSLQKKYRFLQPNAQIFAEAIVTQLEKLLGDANIALGFPIEHRVKSWESIADKIDRTKLKIRNLLDLLDFVGLRLSLLFKRDVENVCKLLSNNFVVVRSYDTMERLKDDQFGYSSIHYIIKLPKKWLAVPTLSTMGDFQAEIQIRTLAQHIWAASSHILQYKQEQSVPPSVRRSIYRVSALLETVDLEFERVLFERESYIREVKVEKTQERLNVDLLAKIMDDSLPEINKEEGDEDYSMLLQELTVFKVDTAEDLISLIKENQEKAIEEEKSMVETRRKEMEEGAKLIGTSHTRTTKGVYFTHVGLIRRMLNCKFEKKYETYLEKKNKTSTFKTT